MGCTSTGANCFRHSASDISPNNDKITKSAKLREPLFRLVSKTMPSWQIRHVMREFKFAFVMNTDCL